MSGAVHAAYSEFYGAQRPVLVERLRRLVGDGAEDVAQDALAEAFVRWDHVSDHRSPEAWLWVVARRMAWRRGHRERMRTKREAQLSSPVSLEIAEDVRQLLGRLPTAEQTALVMHHVEGRSIAEVAEHLGIGEGAAKVWLHRVRRRVAPEVSGLCGRWAGSTRWTTDDVVGEARSLGLERHEDTLARLVPGGRQRRSLAFRGDRFRLELETGEHLDAGRFHLSGGMIVLDSDDVPGHVRLSASLDAGVARFRFVDNTTPLWHGVEERVYIHLLYEMETFTWSPAAAADVRPKNSPPSP